MKRLIALAGACALLALSACASIVSGSAQNMTFDSAPQGAKVVVNGNTIGITPLSLKLPRDSDTVVSFQKDGFKTQTYPLKHHLNPVFWGNIITGGLIGSSIDSSTGAITEYEPDHFFATLQPADAPAAANGIADKRTEVSQFITTNFDSITKELAMPHPKGEHVSALLAMLNITGNDGDAAAGVLRDLRNQAKTAGDFDNAVLIRFGLAG